MQEYMEALDKWIMGAASQEEELFAKVLAAKAVLLREEK